MDVAVPEDRLAAAVARATAALCAHQRGDGHFVFELEADATIPAEYVLLEHFLDRIDAPLERKIGVYLRAVQGAHGGWPLFHDGAFNLSCSVKAYFALKAIGDDPDAPHMRRAREAILAAGGAERSNVFTRAQLALFGAGAVARGAGDAARDHAPAAVVSVPPQQGIVLVAHGDRAAAGADGETPRARNPRGVHVAELFRTPPERVSDWIRGPYRSAWGRFFKGVDVLLRAVQPWFPRRGTARAVAKAVAFVTERLNGDDGLGGIYPAIANSVMMFDTLGYPPDHPPAETAWRAVRKLLVIEDERAYCQPCLSPVWDTSLAGHALAEAGVETDRACAWLKPRQITEVVGDWSVRRPGLAPGGWAFQVREPALPRCR